MKKVTLISRVSIKRRNKCLRFIAFTYHSVLASLKKMKEIGQYLYTVYAYVYSDSEDL